MAVVFSVVLVYYQYYYRQKPTKDSKAFSFLRLISVLGILMLLINPQFESKRIELQKPHLFLTADNSASISHSGFSKILRDVRQLFLKDKELNERFDLSNFSFGATISTDTLLQFDRDHSNLFKAIQDVNSLSNDRLSAIVLLSDGNQTYGSNYAYMSSKNPIFPVVIGDTTARADIEISRINVNAYATLDNNFPVELFLNSNVNQDVKSSLIIEKNGIELYRSSVNFTEKKKSNKLSLYLAADTVGMQLFKARLIPFDGERELTNNSRSFGVEILDEQAEIAIVYKVLHPDLGMIKRSIETNKQRRAVLLQPRELDSVSKDYSLYVLYQPDESFKGLIEQLELKQSNLFIITGSQTDWGFLNDAHIGFYKEMTAVTEDLFPGFENDFNAFYIEDIGFEFFPPLKGQLGKISFNQNPRFLLTQKIDNIATDSPLLAVYSHNEAKGVVLFGENIWKWRIHCFSAYGSFEKFDQFFNSLIQFLQLSNREQDLDLFYKPVYHAKELISIQAKKYDSNLKIALNSKLVFELNDSLKGVPFYVENDAYEVQLKNLKDGVYSFKVKDLDSDIEKGGSFEVVPFSIEQESEAPNVEDLSLLALNSGGKLYYQDQFDALKSELLENQRFRTIEKVRTNLISLIDWRWLLGLIVLSLSLEWLLRKYRGMI